MYYFAYGSNMNLDQMRKRCSSGFKFLCRVKLKDYKFVYDGYSENRKGAVANIIKSNNDIVWGGLFEVNKDCIEKLDFYEGYPNSYNRIIVKVEDDKKTFMKL